MKIGIPRSFLYYKYHVLWETFFDELGIDYIISPETNKDIIQKGTSRAIDEACLPSKIFMGHIESLIGKCDYIFVPRIASLGTSKDIVCSKFQAIYDLVKNTFREEELKLLYYSIDMVNKDTELKAFLKMGKFLGKKKLEILKAYFIAKQAEKTTKLLKVDNQEKKLESQKLKILVVAHPYNIYDAYIGKPVLTILEDLDTIPILACEADEKKAKEKSKELTQTLPWVFNKELVGTISLYKEQVDGIILVSAFPCGPDSLVNDMMIRKIKDKPIINLILDSQEATAGMETRLESFIDIIRLRKEHQDGEK